MNELVPQKVIDLSNSLSDVDVFIAAAGFEDRAFHVLGSSSFPVHTQLVLILYDNDIPENRSTAQRYKETALRKFGGDRVHIVYLRQSRIHDFTNEFVQTLQSFSPAVDKFGIDISGMPSYLIFSSVNTVRESRPYQNQKIIYTAAQEYTPTKEEYESLKAKQGDDIEFIPKSMALEMAENLIFDPFSGYRSAGVKSCLALFAGYEAHRSTGVVEAINPSLLLLMYGQPADKSLSWRHDLSKRLHNKFEKTRRCAVEVVPTWDVGACLAKLEEYYNFLIDDYDLTVAAVCSKMQTIASFLFWERYPEVQVTFPLPIGYDPARRPKGIEATYMLDLPGRLAFWWSGSERANTKKGAGRSSTGRRKRR